uniref:MICOS complex subunit MIC13 n=1 Tax=Amblyomma tuberculatum TaxID=48802 RepID=A0A6M2E1X9_9ACAR
MVMKGILKFGVLGGAIYVTQKAGVWGDSTQTTENVKAYINTNPTLKYYCALTPTRKEFGMKAVDYWNDGVKATFNHLLKTPQYTKQAASWCVDALSGLMEEPKAAASKDIKKPSQ